MPAEEFGFHGPVKAWTCKYVARNLWRFKGHYEYEDLLQEAALKLCHVLNRYPNITNHAHLMALYKTALRNHFHDLAKKSNINYLELDSQTLETSAGIDYNTGYIKVLASQAPEEVKLLIKSITTAQPTTNYMYKVDLTRKCRPKKETTNEKLCRMLNVATQPIVQKTKSWFTR